MTISNTATRWPYTGDGATVNFTYSNKIFANTDLDVYLDGTLQTLTTHYTVSGAGNEGGGTVTFVTPPPNLSSVIIVRDVPVTQGTDIPVGGPFLSTAVENELDKSRIIDQQLNEKIGRALSYPVTDQSEKKYDAGSLVIENVADGVAANDAANKGQLDEIAGSASAAAASAAAAAGSASAASSSASAAAASAAEAADIVDGTIQTIPTLAALLSVDVSGFSGEEVRHVKGYLNGWATMTTAPVGGGDFIYDASRAKSEHDGVVVHSPTVPFDGNTGASLTDYLSGTGETDGGGTGCWVRVNKGFLTPEDAGCNGGATDDTNPMQAAITAASLYSLPLNQTRNIQANVTISGKTNWDANNTTLTPVTDAPVVTINASNARVVIRNLAMILGSISRAWTACDGIHIIGDDGSEDYMSFDNILIRGAPGYGMYAYGSAVGGNVVQRLHVRDSTIVDSEYANLRLEGVVLECQFTGCFFNDGCKLGAFPSINDQLTHSASPARTFRRGAVEILRWYTAADTATNDLTPNRIDFTGCVFTTNIDWVGDPTKRVAAVYVSGGQNITFKTCNFEKPYPGIWLAKEDGTTDNFTASSAGVSIDNCTMLSLGSDPFLSSSMIIWDGYNNTNINSLVVRGSGTPTIPSAIEVNNTIYGGLLKVGSVSTGGITFSSGETISRTSTAYVPTRLIANARHLSVLVGNGGLVVGKANAGHSLHAISSNRTNLVTQFTNDIEIKLSCDTSVNGSLTVVHDADDGAGSPAPLDGRMILSGAVNATLDANWKWIKLTWDATNLVFREIQRNF